MRSISIVYFLNLFLMVFAVALSVPIIFVLIFDELNYLNLFLLPGLGLFVPTLLLHFGLRHYRSKVDIRDSVLVIVLAWALIIVAATLPFLLYKGSWIDALFESASGLTTSGGEVFSGLDSWPRCLQFYHQWLQWLGGLGVIVLVESLGPFIGLGRVKLYQNDIVETFSDSKIIYRIHQVSRMIWLVYLTLTGLCVLSYYCVGLSFFDALCIAMSTVSTGGFMIHDQGFLAYHNVLAEWVAIVFMFLGGMKFILHYRFFIKREGLSYFRNKECCYWMIILLVLILLTCALYGVHWGMYAWMDHLRYIVFMVMSMLTTTGFMNINFFQWSSGLPVILLMMALIGGCVGSTTGGIKPFRWILMAQNAKRTLKQMLHPHAVFKLHFGGQSIEELTMQTIQGYCFCFFLIICILWFALLLTNMPADDAFVGVISSVTNLGQSIHGLAGGYGHLMWIQKLIFVLAMLVGRLEILLVLVCLLPSFWRRF